MYVLMCTRTFFEDICHIVHISVHVNPLVDDISLNERIGVRMDSFRGKAHKNVRDDLGMLTGF